MKEVLVKLGDRSYPIIIAHYTLRQLGSYINDKNLGKQAADRKSVV